MRSKKMVLTENPPIDHYRIMNLEAEALLFLGIENQTFPFLFYENCDRIMV